MAVSIYNKTEVLEKRKKVSVSMSKTVKILLVLLIIRLYFISCMKTRNIVTVDNVSEK
jgi:hypothetical protein